MLQNGNTKMQYVIFQKTLQQTTESHLEDHLTLCTNQQKFAML